MPVIRYSYTFLERGLTPRLVPEETKHTRHTHLFSAAANASLGTPCPPLLPKSEINSVLESGEFDKGGFAIYQTRQNLHHRESVGPFHSNAIFRVKRNAS